MNENFNDKIEAALKSMKMSIEQEDYSEFFELFGDIYCELNNELTYATKQKEDNRVDEMYDLIFYDLIPDSILLAGL